MTLFGHDDMTTSLTSNLLTKLLKGFHNLTGPKDRHRRHQTLTTISRVIVVSGRRFPFGMLHTKQDRLDIRASFPHVLTGIPLTNSSDVFLAPLIVDSFVRFQLELNYNLRPGQSIIFGSNLITLKLTAFGIVDNEC